MSKSCFPCVFVLRNCSVSFGCVFLVGVFSGRVICGARRSMKWSLCSPKWMDIGTSGAKTTERTPNFKWDELICTRWEVLHNRLQLALTSLVLDNAGSQPRCAVRHADMASQIKKKKAGDHLTIIGHLFKEWFRSSSVLHGGTEPTQDETRSKHMFLSAMPRSRNNITTFFRVTQLPLA